MLLFVLSGGCLQDAPPSNPAQSIGFLKSLTDDPDPTVRRTATEALGKIGQIESIPSVAHRLLDESPIVREAAARSLGRFPDLPSDAQLRLVAALTDTAPLVRRSAALSLATTSLAPQTVLRIMALFDQEDLHDRAVLSMALLGDSTERPSASLIHDALEGDGDVRQAAVAALGEIGQNEATTIIRECLHHDPSASVRAEAAYRLHFLSSSDVTTDLVAASRNDASEQVRRWAREGLTGNELLDRPGRPTDQSR